jgi:hypothetical protein
MWKSLMAKEQPITAKNKVIGGTWAYNEVHMHRADRVTMGSMRDPEATE